MAKPPQKFSTLVHNVVRRIPRGGVLTYGQVAALIGRPRAARQVGWTLLSTGDMNIPWQRVVGAGGFLTIRNPDFTPELQKDLLEAEGIQVVWAEKKQLYQIIGFTAYNQKAMEAFKK